MELGENKGCNRTHGADCLTSFYLVLIEKVSSYPANRTEPQSWRTFEHHSPFFSRDPCNPHFIYLFTLHKIRSCELDVKGY